MAAELLGGPHPVAPRQETAKSSNRSSTMPTATALVNREIRPQGGPPEATLAARPSSPLLAR